MINFKRMVSLLMTVVMVATGIVMMPATEVSAATPSKYENKKLVKCGKYLFSAVYQADKSKYTIIRTTTSGKSKKTVASGVENSNIYSNGSKVFYEKNNNVMYYSVKTKKSYTFAKNVDIFGCCKKGLLSKTNVYGQNTKIVLKSFGGKTIKTIVNTSSDTVEYSFLGSNSKYAFFVRSTRASGDSYYGTYNSSIFRYTLSNKKIKRIKTLSQITTSYYPTVVDSYVFDKYLVFSIGIYDGSALIYDGDTYKMKKDGSSVTRVTSESKAWGETIVQGKSCVYVSENSLNGSAKKITSSGKVSTVKKSSAKFVANGYSLYTKQNKSYNNSYELIGKKGSSTKKLISAKSVIKKSDPSDAYVVCDIYDSVGKMVLVTCKVHTYEGAYGWRPQTLRTNVYLVNTSTKKAIRID